MIAGTFTTSFTSKKSSKNNSSFQSAKVLSFFKLMSAILKVIKGAFIKMAVFITVSYKRLRLEN
jgi:hypothetical protein